MASKGAKNTLSQKRKYKSVSSITATIAVVLLVIGLVVGFYISQAISKGDKFELVGTKNIVLTVGDSGFISEEGVTIISFGKNISNKVKIETGAGVTKTTGGYNIDTSEEGDYYIKYTVEDFKMGNVVRYRTITVQEASE